MNFTWQKISAIVTIITVVCGAAVGIERYVAKQESHEKLVAVVAKSDDKYVSIEDFLAMNKRISINSLEDLLYKTQQRLWQFEDRYEKTKETRKVFCYSWCKSPVYLSFWAYRGSGFYKKYYSSFRNGLIWMDGRIEYADFDQYHCIVLNVVYLLLAS